MIEDGRTFEQLLRLTSDAVAEAARRSGVVRPTGGGFDGREWVWMWNFPEGSASSSPVQGQVSVRAQPDSLGDGVQLEVLGSAWKRRRPDVSWTRVYWVQFLGLDLDGQREDELGARLVDPLLQAMDDTQRNMGRLDSLAEEQDRLKDWLRERRLLSGK